MPSGTYTIQNIRCQCKSNFICEVVGRLDYRQCPSPKASKIVGNLGRIQGIERNMASKITRGGQISQIELKKMYFHIL